MNKDHPKMTSSQILITVAAFVIVVAGMRASVVILVPFLLAVFIAIIGAPPLFWMQRKGIPNWISLFIVILGIFFIGFLIAGLVGSSVKAFSRDLPAYESKFRQYTASIVSWLGTHGVDPSGLALPEIFNPGAAMKLVATLLNSLSKVLTNGFLILMTVILMLVEASSLPGKLRNMLADPEHSLVHFDKFIDNLKRYIAIKTLISLVTGIVITVWLTILRVDYPFLWGLLAFALNYIPTIGSIIAAVPAVLITVGVAAGYLVINMLMSSVIEPRLMGRRLGLSTLVVFLSLLFWGWVLGPIGMLLSVPLTITAKIALESREETRWLAILLGPEFISKEVLEKSH
jgi:predicted PurR-regulated permease PerM